MPSAGAPSLPAASSSTATAPPRQTSREPLFIPSPPPVNSDDDSDDLSEQPDSDEDQLAGDSDAAPAAGPVASTSRLPAVASPAARASSNHFGSPAGGSKSGSKSGSPKKPRARPSAGGGIFVGAIPPLPHYEIKHSSPNSQSNPHRIKIKSGVTDGLKKNWPDPATTQPGGLIDGRTNWYELQPPNEGKHLSWRQNLGKELATKLELEKTTAGESCTAPYSTQA